ncbi:MAG: hypothetical protein A2Z14_05190 [Chloroflexi bacterium RBG_16_48_8]|nr:MAG: hypothetical protein A2Z14_05190 [Chloroflexi bacterium RBG_16_48_8]
MGKQDICQDEKRETRPFPAVRRERQYHQLPGQVKWFLEALDSEEPGVDNNYSGSITLDNLRVQAVRVNGRTLSQDAFRTENSVTGRAMECRETGIKGSYSIANGFSWL